jgi:hypothetical protein
MHNDRAPWGLILLAACLLALGCWLFWWAMTFDWGPMLRVQPSTGSSRDTYISAVVPTPAAPRPAPRDPACSVLVCRMLWNS